VSAVNEGTTRPTTRSSPGARVLREARAALELWLLPAVVALLPYRAGIALARALCAALPLYREATEASAAQWRCVAADGDERAWRAAYRFALLVDHADLFWSLTRRPASMLARLRVPPIALPDGPLVVVSFHYGQGLWLLNWLRSLGRAPRFVAIRLVREEAGSTLEYAYALLRNRQVGRLSGAAPIYTGGARAEIAATLGRSGTVYGLIDVPVAPQARTANAEVFSTATSLPTGLVESATAARASMLVLSAFALRDGTRDVHAGIVSRDDRPIAAIAAEFEARVRRAPAAWHFWHLWPALQAAPATAR
jgi:hypothetical protein